MLVDEQKTLIDDLQTLITGILTLMEGIFTRADGMKTLMQRIPACRGDLKNRPRGVPFQVNGSPALLLYIPNRAAD